MPHSADNSAMAARRDVPPGPGVGFLDVPRGKNLFVENRNGADIISPVSIGPNARSDVVHGIDDITISVIANGPRKDCDTGSATRSSISHGYLAGWKLKEYEKPQDRKLPYFNS